MPPVAGVIAIVAVLVAGAATAVTWSAAPWLRREHRRIYDRLTPGQRRSAYLKQAVMYLVVLAWLAVIVAAPFGLRDNLTYFVIIPFVVVIPIALFVVGARGRRNARRHRRHHS